MRVLRLGRSLRSLAWVALLGAFAGCNRGPTLIPVQGKVTSGDKPLTTGFVIFHPDAARGNTSKEEPRADIDKQGNYVLLTRLDKGAAPGWYKVTVTAADQLDPKNPYFTKWLIPQKYIDPKMSGIAIQVVGSAAAGAYDLKLEPK